MFLLLLAITSQICPPGQSQVNSVCVNCQITYCQNCPVARSCSLCFSGYFFFNNICKLCNQDFDCEICQPNICGHQSLTPSQSNCKYCCLHIQGNCLKAETSCDNGYFLQQSRCFACMQFCTTCQRLDYCTQCVQSYILFNNNCIQKCPDRYYLQQNSCLACRPVCLRCLSYSYKCLTCDASTLHYRIQGNDCIECYFKYSISQETLTCYQDKCPLGYSQFLIGPKNMCQKCLNNCKVCQSLSTCKSCLQGFYLSVNSCLQCTSNCAQCDNQNTCKYCVKNSLLFESKCDSKCPKAYYRNNFNRTCLSCTVCPPEEVVVKVIDVIRILSNFFVNININFDLSLQLQQKLSKDLFNFGLQWSSGYFRKLQTTNIYYDSTDRLIYVTVNIPQYFSRSMELSQGLVKLNISLGENQFFPNQVSLIQGNALTTFNFISNNKVQGQLNIYLQSGIALSIISLILGFVHYFITGRSNGMSESLLFLFFNYMTIYSNVDPQSLSFIYGLQFVSFSFFHRKFTETDRFGNFYLFSRSAKIFQGGILSAIFFVVFPPLLLALYKISKISYQRFFKTFQSNLKLQNPMSDVKLRLKNPINLLICAVQYLYVVIKESLLYFAVVNLAISRYFSDVEQIVCFGLSLGLIVIYLSKGIASKIVLRGKRFSDYPLGKTLLNISNAFMIVFLSIQPVDQYKYVSIFPKFILLAIQASSNFHPAEKILKAMGLVLEIVGMALMYHQSKSKQRLVLLGYSILLIKLIYLVFILSLEKQEYKKEQKKELPKVESSIQKLIMD